jgi:hypothetical protein
LYKDGAWVLDFIDTSSTPVYTGGGVGLYYSSGGSFDNFSVICTPSTVAPPTFSPDGSYITGPTAITISSVTEGASIYYTTDGTLPATSQTGSTLLYTEPGVIVNPETTLKAIAVADGCKSGITSMTYAVSGRFSMGWYAMHLTDWNLPLGMTPLDESQTHGFDYVMPYFAFSSGDSAVLSYLDSALARGVKVLIDLHPAEIPEVQRRVNLVKDHAAVYGYYLEDEPEVRDISAQTVIDKYNAVKAKDDNPNHPVVLTFYKPLAEAQDYLPAADIVARELYTVSRISQVQNDVTIAMNAGKKYIALPGAYQESGHTMPSASQMRYMILGSIAGGADGIMPFIFEGTPSSDQSDVPAAGWRDAIVYPTTDLLPSIAPLLSKGSSGLTSSSTNAQANGITWVFKGTSNDAVLVAANNSSSSRSAIDFSVDGVNHPVTSVSVVGESRTVTMNSTGQITDSFTGYGSHIYKFTAATSGDANTDGKVDVGDLGILAANYGKTSGATWDLGDFNGDGAVDVGDLGILAANYGSSGSGFEADYAKVFFGTADGASAEDDEETTNSLCSSLGLSLIAGLAMLGLMIVKLDE